MIWKIIAKSIAIVQVAMGNEIVCYHCANVRHGFVDDEYSTEMRIIQVDQLCGRVSAHEKRLGYNMNSRIWLETTM